MDYFTKGSLAVISAALLFIAVQAYQINTKLQPTLTMGDYYALSDLKDPAARQEAHKLLVKRLPMVNVSGGHLNAEVSGYVTCD